MAGTALPPAITDATVHLTYNQTVAGGQTGVADGTYYGYCLVADVQFEFTNRGQMVTLTNSAIAQEITAAAIEMQEMLDHYYVMPYTGTTPMVLTMLRIWNTKLAVSLLIERYFTGSEPDMSPWAAAYRRDVEVQLVDVEHGRIRFDTPFGDATTRGMLPVYQLSSGATIYPNPAAADPTARQPLFAIGGIRYSRAGRM